MFSLVRPVWRGNGVRSHLHTDIDRALACAQRERGGVGQELKQNRNSLRSRTKKMGFTERGQVYSPA